MQFVLTTSNTSRTPPGRALHNRPGIKPRAR